MHLIIINIHVYYTINIYVIILLNNSQKINQNRDFHRILDQNFANKSIPNPDKFSAWHFISSCIDTLLQLTLAVALACHLKDIQKLILSPCIIWCVDMLTWCSRTLSHAWLCQKCLGAEDAVTTLLFPLNMAYNCRLPHVGEVKWFYTKFEFTFLSPNLESLADQSL